MLSAVSPANAGDFSKPEELVVKADISFSHFVADPNMTWFRDHAKNAKGVFIVPQLLKAGFIYGGSGGSGALLARDPKTPLSRVTCLGKADKWGFNLKVISPNGHHSEN